MAAAADNSLMLEILKTIQKEQNNQRTLLLLTVDSVRKLQQFTEQKFLGVDKRFNDVDKRFLDMEERMKAHKDDLEMMLKAELLGAMTNYQIRIENYVHERLAEKAE
jgi:hypothetical protein